MSTVPIGWTICPTAERDITVLAGGEDLIARERALQHGLAEAVTTAFPLATDAGLEILRAGGNAFDAAVAAAWALCVCEPSASGLGGQTVMLVHHADGRTTVVDGHSSAPMAASIETIGRNEQRSGHRSSTVPTTPATLDWVQRTYGSLDRQSVLAPAIRIAEEGFAITELQHRQARWVADDLGVSAGGQLFLHKGRAPPVGFTFRQPELAMTLRRLAELGADEFYRGNMARQIVDDMQAHGGLISQRDLAACGPPLERAAISTSYRGFRVLTVPAPGGGVQLLSALNVLAELARAGLTSSVEGWRKAVALATSTVFRERDLHPFSPNDPALCVEDLLSEAYARRLARDVAGSEAVFAKEAAEEPGDTTHLAACDRYGNIVLLTQSIQSVFGAKVAHRDLGFLYNNYLCTCPRKPHPYALRGGCRPRSNISPTLVMQGGTDSDRPILAVGAAGSRRIISAIIQVISGIIDHGLDIAAAVAAPRVHGLRSRKVWIERPAASDRLLDELRMSGREPIIKSRLNFAMGSVQALQFLPDGRVSGAADPRRDGTAEVLQ